MAFRVVRRRVPVACAETRVESAARPGTASDRKTKLQNRNAKRKTHDVKPASSILITVKLTKIGFKCRKTAQDETFL